MARLFIPALTIGPEAMRSTVRSKWLLAFFAVPLLCFALFLRYEGELTHLIIPFFPAEPDKSFAFYNDFLWLCFYEMLWLSFFLLISWALWVYIPLHKLVDRLNTPPVSMESGYVAATACFAFAAALAIAAFALYAFPNSADEYVYLYQAETLAEGKLVQEAHPLEDFFHFNHIAQKQGVSVGRFPPGWPLLLSVPYYLGVPAYWLNPFLGALALILFFAFAKDEYGVQVALISMIGLAFTSYFLFNSASYFSHTSCLLFTVAFVYCINRAHKAHGGRYSLLAGIFLGSILLTRYYTAALILTPVIVAQLFQYRWKAMRPLCLVALGSLPFFALLLWYNYRITGHAFLPVTVWADSTEAIGFVKGHTFMRGVEYTVRRMFLFLYWCSPALLILYFFYLFQKMRDRSTRFVHPEDYFLAVLFAGYFFYHHIGGNQYGPRFVFEALPFALVFVVDRAVKSHPRLPLALLAAGMLYAVIKVPFIIHRENRIVNERLDLYRTVDQAHLSRAVVLVATHTGVIRPMPPRDLTRNDVYYENDVIFAEDLGDRNRQLMDYYPNRTFYRYVRNREKAEGWLEKVVN